MKNPGQGLRVRVRLGSYSMDWVFGRLGFQGLGFGGLGINRFESVPPENKCMVHSIELKLQWPKIISVDKSAPPSVERVPKKHRVNTLVFFSAMGAQHD